MLSPTLANLTQFEQIDLRSLGLTQPVDTDLELAEIGRGSLLLLNQRPQCYGWEQHGVDERIVVIDGQVGIVAEDGRRLAAGVGTMIVVPAGLRHAYCEASNGVVLVLFGGQGLPAQGSAPA